LRQHADFMDDEFVKVAQIREISADFLITTP